MFTVIARVDRSNQQANLINQFVVPAVMLKSALLVSYCKRTHFEESRKKSHDVVYSSSIDLCLFFVRVCVVGSCHPRMLHDFCLDVQVWPAIARKVHSLPICAKNAVKKCGRYVNCVAVKNFYVQCAFFMAGSANDGYADRCGCLSPTACNAAYVWPSHNHQLNKRSKPNDPFGALWETPTHF